MYLEIVTPEATLFSGEITALTVPGVNGEFQMLHNHAPIISILGKGNLKIQGDIALTKEYAHKFTKGNGNETFLPINSGTIELKRNKIVVLAD
jgi:F-type H+-transporting ATPase subunit epsilon